MNAGSEAPQRLNRFFRSRDDDSIESEKEADVSDQKNIRPFIEDLAMSMSYEQ
jgi:hypothetical protein